MAQPFIKVFLHNSVPGRTIRHAIWSGKLSLLGLNLALGDAPEPGTRIAVVGDELYFEPFSSEAELLLRRLATTSVLGAKQPSHPQQQQADSISTTVTSRSKAASAGAITCTTKPKGTAVNSVDTASCATTTASGAGVSDMQRTAVRAAAFGSPGAAEPQASNDSRGGRHGDGVRQSPALVDDASAGSAVTAPSLFPPSPMWITSALWTAWPPVVLLVSERWLVDCVASRSLLDPKPYDVRQRVQHREEQLVKRRQQQQQQLRRDGGGKKSRRFAPDYGSDEEEYGSIEAEGGQHGRSRGGGEVAAVGWPVSKSAEVAAARPRQRQHQPAGSHLVRQWISPRLGKPGLPGLLPLAAAVIVGETPQPLGWWDPTHGSFVQVPDHLGRLRCDPPADDVSHHSGVGVGAGNRNGGVKALAATRALAAAKATSVRSSSIRIVSYNVLGNTACMTSSGPLRKLPTAHRELSYRGPRLLQEVKSYDADVMCLQEVDVSVFQLWLHPWAEAEGYDILYLPRGATRPLQPTDLPPPPPRVNPFGNGTAATAKRRRTSLSAGAVTDNNDGEHDVGDSGGGGGGGGGGSSAAAMCPAEVDGVALLIRRKRLRVAAVRCTELSEQLPDSCQGSFWQSLRNRGVVAILALLQWVEDPRVNGADAAIQTAGSRSGGHGSAKVCDDGSRGVETIDGGNGGGGGGDDDGGSGSGGSSNGSNGGDGVDVDNGNGMFVVGTTHIWWDPRLPDVKVGEAHQLCRTVVEFLRSQGFQRPQDVPLVLCGDWNTRWLIFRTHRYDRVPPGGCLVGGVYELMTRGSLAPQHPHHPSTRRCTDEAVELHTSGLRLASAYLVANGREPAATVISHGFRDCLDYVWVSRGHWAVTATLNMPYLYGSDPRADEPARGGAGGDAETDGSGYEGDGSTPPPSNEGDTARDGSSGGSVGGIDLCCGGRSGGGGGISSSSGGGGGSSSGGGGGDDIIRVSWALGTPGCGWVWEMPVMPNEEWPSDHLAVGVELVLVGSKRALPLKP